MLLQRLINIHCVETRHVKACYPHRHDDSNLEVRVWILKQHIKCFPVFIRTYQFAQFWIIVLLTSHHQSDALYWCLVFRANLLFPFGAQGNNLFIQIVSNLATGAHKHCLTANGASFLYSLFVVLNEISCHH